MGNFSVNFCSIELRTCTGGLNLKRDIWYKIRDLARLRDPGFKIRDRYLKKKIETQLRRKITLKRDIETQLQSLLPRPTFFE